MTREAYEFDWNQIAYDSKKPLNKIGATMIAAPREISLARLKELVRQYLQKSDIILGIAKEDYIDGFYGQPHFKTFKKDKSVSSLIDKVNARSPNKKIYTLEYFQRDLPHIIDKLRLGKVVFVNGSWQRMFHVNKIYYQLVNSRTEFELISPFTDEEEALRYLKKVEPEITKKYWPKDPRGTLTEQEMLANANEVAKFSFDYGFQTGVTIGTGVKGGYKHLVSGFNKVVPYQTYAFHFGASREKNFTPPQDVSHYDAVHAEVITVMTAAKNNISLKGTTLFINLLPCPFCARMFTQTEIQEFVYSEDHSSGYTVQLLEKAGKKVRRLLPDQGGK